MRLLAFFRITRPVNSVALGVLVLASSLVASSGGSLSYTIALAVIGTILVAAGGYVFNDVCDQNTDRVVHRKRVLPRGEMSVRVAKVYALGLLFGSVLLFLFINHLSFFSAFLSAILLFLYSWRLKNASGIVGNLVTALLVSNAVLLGSFVVGSTLAGVLPLVVCVFFATFSREIAKDVEDLPGDKGARAQTMPMLVGSRNASVLAALFLCIAIVATYLPYQQLIFDRSYLVAASAVNIIHLYAAIRLALEADKGIHATQRLIKVGMFLYVFLFLFGALYWMR